ncbi:MAG: uracil phosphoribosyltransferase, partial [Bacteroidia bacterium]
QAEKFSALQIKSWFYPTLISGKSQTLFNWGLLRIFVDQNGFLSAFRKADAAFIAAYRKSTSDIEFEIITEYEAKPNLNGKTLIIVDTMCATARSFLACYEKLTQGFEPKKVIFASVFASKTGIETISSKIPQIVHYTCVVDDELNAKSYIVPGLGDAGDLAFGNKI